MADNDQNNEEYEFSDMEGISPELGDVGDETEQYESSDIYGAPPTSNVRRNALIVIGAAVFLMLGYQFIGSWFTVQKELPKETPKVAMPIKAQPQPQPIQPVVQPSQIPEPPVTASQDEKAIKQKIAAMEIGQQSLRQDISTMSNQMSGMNSNVNDLSEQYSKINQMLEQLSQQLEQQSAELARLRMNMKPKRVHPAAKVRTIPVTYNLQAVIPGRAWLIASNGSTLTVREGTTIKGYGMVKLIDPIQGKVITSSGKIIRFSQQDS